MASRRQTTLVIVVVALLLILGGAIVFQFRDQIFTAVGVPETTADPISGTSWSITKSAAPSQIEPGDSVTYTLEWIITGQGVAGPVIIVDDYDQTAIASIAGLTQGAVDSGDIITWDLGGVDLSSGSASGSLSYIAVFNGTFSAPLPYSAVNTATLSTLDPQGSDTDSATVTVAPPIIVDPPPPDPPQAALAIVKNVQDVNGDVVRRGDLLRYSITLQNTGKGTSTGVTVTDNVGAYLEGFTVETFPSGAKNGSTSSGGTNGTGYLSISGFNLGPGVSELITYTATVASNAPDGQAVPNVVLASDDQGNNVQDNASVTVLVAAPPIEVLEGTILSEDPSPATQTPQGSSTSSVTQPQSLAQSSIQSSGASGAVTSPTPTTTAQAVVVPETGIDSRAAVWLIFTVLSALGISLYVWYVLRRVLR